MDRLTERLIFGKTEGSYCQALGILLMVLIALPSGSSSINKQPDDQSSSLKVLGSQLSFSLEESARLFLIVTFYEPTTQHKTK